MFNMRFRLLVCAVFLVAVVAVTYLLAGGSSPVQARATAEAFPGQPMALTPPAHLTLQQSEKAFPSETAGFSAYYRIEDSGAFSLDKGAVDSHIFSPVEPGDTTLRTAPATLVDVGGNYTVATLTLQNIDALVSTVNLYYDDEGWVVAYLSSGEASALIWQAKGIDVENPKVDEIGGAVLLEAINVVVDEALDQTAITNDTTGLGYYHWQFPDADNFLMMAVSRKDQGEYPVQFAVPDTFTLSEISASLWISQGANVMAPCATVTLDDMELIARQCAKGIYSGTINLGDLPDTTGHTWKLIHSERDEGGSGSMMMIIYASS